MSSNLIEPPTRYNNDNNPSNKTIEQSRKVAILGKKFTNAGSKQCCGTLVNKSNDRKEMPRGLNYRSLP